MAFAPAYRPAKQQQTYSLLAQRHKAEKRKRNLDSSDEDDDEGSPPNQIASAHLKTATTPFRPVNRTDPYHVAGRSREEPLPSNPFPHAAVKDDVRRGTSIEEELAGLDLPFLNDTNAAGNGPTTHRRRHIDNITSILHKSMLNGDWPRASRAWQLLIRTELHGRPIDIRRNDRWVIGAEILMRRNTGRPPLVSDVVPATDHLDEEASEDSRSNSSSQKPTFIPNPDQFSSEGFKLARDYYDRLVLQYPHIPRQQHRFNATAVYPALFNIWVYEVQDRFKRLRQSHDRPSTSHIDSSDHSIISDHASAERRDIYAAELDQARAIATRMDELLLSPPYDTHHSLLDLRANVALWMAYLHAQLAESVVDAKSADASVLSDADADIDVAAHRAEAQHQRRAAGDVYRRMQRLGVHLSRKEREVLQEG